MCTVSVHISRVLGSCILHLHIARGWPRGTALLFCRDFSYCPELPKTGKGMVYNAISEPDPHHLSPQLTQPEPSSITRMQAMHTSWGLPQVGCEHWFQLRDEFWIWSTQVNVENTPRAVVKAELFISPANPALSGSIFWWFRT